MQPRFMLISSKESWRCPRYLCSVVAANIIDIFHHKLHSSCSLFHMKSTVMFYMNDVMYVPSTHIVQLSYVTVIPNPESVIWNLSKSIILSTLFCCQVTVEVRESYRWNVFFQRPSLHWSRHCDGLLETNFCCWVKFQTFYREISASSFG